MHHARTMQALSWSNFAIVTCLSFFLKKKERKYFIKDSLYTIFFFQIDLENTGRLDLYKRIIMMIPY